MTKHIVPLPNPDGSLRLRELNHRINNDLTSVMCTVSDKAVQSDSVAVKAALLDVVDLLHQCADVHRALHMPDQGRLTDAARYLQLHHEIPTGPPGDTRRVFSRRRRVFFPSHLFIDRGRATCRWRISCG
jgi:two-component sensor histidine kinase